jgi:hypothetical protein
MILKLLIDKEEKTFAIPFVSALIWRKYIDLQEKADNIAHLSPEEIDDFASLVVMAFENQFTLEQFYAGIPFNKLMSTIQSLFTPPNDGNEVGNEKK